MSVPYTHACKHTAENECIEFHGILEREEHSDDFSKIRKHEVSISKPRVLVKGYYVDTVGKNTKAIKDYIGEQLKRDKESDQLSMYNPKDPFMGSK